MVASLPSGAFAADFFVSNAGEVSAAMQTAQSGDTLIMANGVWTNQQIDFAGDGASGAPITLRAETPGGVTLNGSSTLSISGDYLVADGLNFQGGALSSGHVVEFRGSNGEATNSRLTNSAIIDYNPADINTRYFWVSLYGQSNRVDHNYFSGQDHSGVTVVVWRDSPAADFHQIDNNYFGDRPEGNDNGFETIRVGTSDESLSDSFTLVENNVFERVDGEIEIISNKSGSNTFRYNTFRESSGTLTLRHGNDTLVEGNFFLGLGKDGSGGVRVIGENQTIINNYFNNLDGRADGAISISAGVENPEVSEYFQVKNAVIAHNSIMGVNEAAITFDHGLGSSDRTLLAEDVTVANNLIFSNQDPLFEGTEGTGWTWEGNLAFGQSLGPKAGDPGVTVVDPQATFDPVEGLFRLAPTSPAIDAAASGYSSLLTDDMDGQPRVGVFDVGADEFSTSAIVRMPLTEGDVGPDWLGNTDPPIGGGGGCNAGGCAIQGEDFSSLLDPDGNGLVWTTVSVAEALGGQVIKAPSGDRVELETEAHDTIATFDLEFETTGTYTAYYRVRGFSSSTDSLFTPDDFDVDPDNNEGISADGQFEWQKDGVTFSISGTEVGVPLEFRLAMREQDAELDAFVLSLDANLSDAELDELFALQEALPGDADGDGDVDGDDLIAVQSNFASVTPPPGDADGDGDVDGDDLIAVQSNFGATSATAVPEPATAWLLAAGVAGLWGRRAPRGSLVV